MKQTFKITKLILCGLIPFSIDSFFPFSYRINSKGFLKNINLKSRKINYSIVQKSKFLEKIMSQKKFSTKLRKEKKIFTDDPVNYVTTKINPTDKIKKYRFSDYAGIEDFFFDIQEFIIWPTLNYRLYRNRHIETSKGILLNGPPGCGKTFLVNVIAGELNLPVFYLSPYKISNPISGVNEKKVQNLFKMASINSPSILFIDEIDSIIPKKDSSSRETEKKIVNQLTFSIDGIRKNKDICVIIIAATNSLEQMDDSIRRPGRIDTEIKFRIPSYLSRLKILKNLLSQCTFDLDFQIDTLALITKGYVSGDLFHLMSTAVSFAVSRLGKILINSSYREKKKEKHVKIIITRKDLDKAKTLFHHVILKNGFSDFPETRWSDIGALDPIKKVLSRYIIEPIRFPSKKSLPRDYGIGLLLYGPPGCGKTMLVNAVVRESDANFIFVKGPEILDKFLGESERKIRSIFSKAKIFEPTIIFFDEFDSLASKREVFQDSSGSTSNDRVVNQLLTEIDSIDRGKKVHFIGATNRPDSIDKALLRPGRIDKIIAVPYPNLEAKILILKTIFKTLKSLPHLNLNLLIKKLKKNFTGAELNLVSREACLDSSKNSIKYFLFLSSKSGLSVSYSNLIGTKNLHYGMNQILISRKTKGLLV